MDKAKEYVTEVGHKIKDVFKKDEPLNSCSDVDMSKIMGTWYEIGRLDTFIQDELYNTSHTFTMSHDKPNCFKVVISGNVKSMDGDRKSFEGSGCMKAGTSGRMDIEFLWPFKVEYVIMDMSSDNKCMLIGTDSRRYAWMLCREPMMSDDIRKDMMKKLDSMGFDISKMYMTKQSSIS